MSEETLPPPPGPAGAEPARQGAAKMQRNETDCVNLNNIDIFYQAPLPQYDQGRARAFLARHKDRSQGSFVALVCDRSHIPRIKDASLFASILHPNIVPMATNGKLYWPPAGQERYVFIYKDVFGRRLLQSGQPLAMGLRNEDVMNGVIRPIVEILDEFHNKDFYYGAISPFNIFDGGQQSRLEKVILGDCLAAPPSCNLPALFEPIERAVVSPVARGAGTFVDDMYNFGVTLAVLLRSHDPMEGLSDHDILRQKIELGSYGAITGKDRFKGSVLELLRGLLHDDPAQRWSIEEVKTWLDGRRLSPKQSVKHKKAARPIEFNEEKYFYAPLLALDLSANPAEVVRMIDTDELQQWLSRSLEDKEMLEKVKDAITAASDRGRNQGFEDRLVSYLSTALDPMGPLRYRDMVLHGDGIGYALAEAMVLKHDLRPFADMLMMGVPLQWITMQENTKLDTSALVARFDSCRNFIRSNKIGFGIERCVYVLNSEVQCLSDKLTSYYVTTPEEMLYAFEDMCLKGKTPGAFMDRHTVAFLAARDSKSVEPFLFDLGSLEDYKRGLANLKVLATLQKRSSMPMFPGIAAAFNDLIPAMYERYHDREVREKIEKTIRRHITAGDLSKMVAILDNAELKRKDYHGFMQAMREYIDLENESINLEASLALKDSFGRSAGKEFAAVVASLIASFVILVTTFMFLAGRSLF